MKRFWYAAALAGTGLLLAAAPALADGTHPVEQQTEMGTGTYVFLLFFVLTLVLALAAVLKKKKTALLRWAWVGGLTGLLLAGTANATGMWSRGEEVAVSHIHGIGYSADGSRLLVAAHDGLRVYAGGVWKRGEGGKNDYMGFSMTDAGFYGSGHPEPGSKLKDPLGLIHSQDEGKSLHMLDFYGEIDFHALTAGYRSHAIYVYNPQPQAKLKEAGVYYSPDEGKTWTRARLAGLGGELGALAAHPDEPGTLAVGTTTGLYASKDGGASATGVFSGKQITSVGYGPDGTLLAGTYSGGKAGLIRLAAGSTKAEEIGAFPPVEKDAVAYLAVNPANSKEWTAASFRMQIYRTSDGGLSWQHIMDSGKGL